eukprot:1161454-Pelagomonas_calceolata.AAC.7
MEAANTSPARCLGSWEKNLREITAGYVRCLKTSTGRGSLPRRKHIGALEQQFGSQHVHSVGAPAIL